MYKKLSRYRLRGIGISPFLPGLCECLFSILIQTRPIDTDKSKKSHITDCSVEWLYDQIKCISLIVTEDLC